MGRWITGQTGIGIDRRIIPSRWVGRYVHNRRMAQYIGNIPCSISWSYAFVGERGGGAERERYEMEKEWEKERVKGTEEPAKKRVHRRWRAIAFNLESRPVFLPVRCNIRCKCTPGEMLLNARTGTYTRCSCVQCNLLSRALYMNHPPSLPPIAAVVSRYGRNELQQRCGPALAATFWMQFRSQISAHPSDRFVATLINLGKKRRKRHRVDTFFALS